MSLGKYSLAFPSGSHLDPSHVKMKERCSREIWEEDGEGWGLADPGGEDDAAAAVLADGGGPEVEAGDVVGRGGGGELGGLREGRAALPRLGQPLPALLLHHRLSPVIVGGGGEGGEGGDVEGVAGRGPGRLSSGLVGQVPEAETAAAEVLLLGVREGGVLGEGLVLVQVEALADGQPGPILLFKTVWGREERLPRIGLHHVGPKVVVRLDHFYGDN